MGYSQWGKKDGTAAPEKIYTGSYGYNVNLNITMYPHIILGLAQSQDAYDYYARGQQRADNRFSFSIVKNGTEQTSGYHNVLWFVIGW